MIDISKYYQQFSTQLLECFAGGIAQLAHELQFSDQSHFHRVFKQHSGVTPKQYYKNL